MSAPWWAMVNAGVEVSTFVPGKTLSPVAKDCYLDRLTVMS